jgi:hypothetical protein
MVFFSLVLFAGCIFAGISGYRSVLITITALGIVLLAAAFLFMAAPDRSVPFIDDRSIIGIFVALGLVVAWAGYLSGFIIVRIRQKLGARQPGEGNLK